MEKLLQDIRYGCRTLIKHPGFATVAVIALALGIGANTAIFSVVNAALLRPLPYHDPDKIMMIWEINAEQGLDDWTVAPAKFVDWRDKSQSFEHIAAFWPYQAANLYFNDQPERIQSAAVSYELFPLLGIAPLKGRTFLPEEDRPGGEQVVVISHQLWQRRFNADPDLVGKPLRIDAKSYTVVGIMPAGFYFPERAEMWLPLALSDDELKNRSAHMVTVIGRMKPNVNAQQAQAEMTVLANQLEQEYPGTDHGWGIKLVPMLDQLVGKMQPAILVLLAAVVLVLLIACANVANLLLARGAARQREIAIRAAMGATKSRLTRQLLTESILLSLIGGALGLLLAYLAVGLLAAAIPENIPRIKDLTISRWVLGFTFLTSLLTGILFGLAPAVQGSRPNLNETLKESPRGSTSGAGSRKIRNVLVISEVAVSLILMISAGLMIRSFLHLQKTDPGFSSSGVLTAQLQLGLSKYPEDKQRTAFYQQVLKKVESLPGVQIAGAISTLPLGGDNLTFPLIIEGRAPQSPSEQLTTNFRVISPDYFAALGIPLKQGRYFTERDNVDSTRVAIINETLANRYFPNENPIGKRISLVIFDEPVLREIVGVVGDVRHSTLDEESGSEVYDSYLQAPSPFMTLAVRTSASPQSLAGGLRNAVRSVDNEQPIFNIKTMEQVLSDSVALPRLSTALLAAFAGIALILASIGIYGLVSYSVTQRTHEIGIRMALGARPGQVLQMILRQGVVLAVVGVAIGLAGAYAATKLLASLLYGVSASDPMTFAVVPLLLIFVTLLASYVPARKAMEVDPIIALRQE